MKNNVMKKRTMEEFIDKMDLHIVNSNIEKVNLTILDIKRENNQKYTLELAVQNGCPHRYVSEYLIEIPYQAKPIDKIIDTVGMKHFSELVSCEIEALGAVSYSKGYKMVHGIFEESVYFCSPNLSEDEFKELKAKFNKPDYSE